MFGSQSGFHIFIYTGLILVYDVSVFLISFGQSSNMGTGTL